MILDSNFYPIQPADTSGTQPSPTFTGELTDHKTLRDEFAMAALAVLTAAPDYSKGPCDAAIADRAYQIADRMIEARKK